MTWREMIKQVGANKIAREMNVKYPTVLKYIKDGATTLPREKMKDLCSVMQKHLADCDFITFMNSLSEEITGVSTSIMQDTGTEG